MVVQNDQLKKGKNNAQNQLRKQLRKEHFNDRQNLYHQIMENPSTYLFYKLMKRNRGGTKQETACICLNGQDYYDSCDQRKCFLQYFEDLSIPIDKEYDNGYLELCNIRQKLTTQIYSEDSSPIEHFKEEDVSKAVKQLNAGKAADEYDIVAEHLKMAGVVIISYATKIFKNKTIPDIFKTGILTPVLKKLKDATQMNKYRGITVYTSHYKTL